MADLLLCEVEGGHHCGPRLRVSGGQRLDLFQERQQEFVRRMRHEVYNPTAAAALSVVRQRDSVSPGAQVEWVPLETRSGNRIRAMGPSAIRRASNTRHSERSRFRSVVMVMTPEGLDWEAIGFLVGFVTLAANPEYRIGPMYWAAVL